MAKFRKKLISATEPLATAAGIRSPVEQLQDLNALSISVVTVCADTSGTDGGLADDTAINTAGGFVKITGTGFRNTSPTTIVYINGVTATYNYLSSTSIVVTVPAAVAGTTASLIVFNGSTVGSIWAAGISYSGFPSWTTTAATNLGVVVSTQLVAVGDAPLTYTLVSGTLPPNCTISSSGLLSGTVTGVSTNAIYTFTVVVTDAQNQNVSQSIVYTLVVSDFYYRYTSLHISGDSNPTWITDASTNALAVAPAGAPQATTFSPLEAGYYGNSFNGSSDYLTLPSTAGLAMGTGDFTIEFWYYPLQADKGVFQLSTTSGGFLAGNTNTIALFIGSINNVGVYASGTTTYGGNNKLLYNVWTHIALVRISSVTKLYLNGVLDTSFASGGLADTTNYTGTYGVIGGYYSTGYLSNAYISNFRIVKGTAVYTANFTPSATPLTAITNTSLLTCQSARFIDNSAAPATITVAGTPKVVSSNPFNLPAGLAVYGSGYFDGSSYLNTASNASLSSTLLASDFTIECWFYLATTTTSYACIWTNSTAGADNFTGVYVNPSRTISIGKFSLNEVVSTATVTLGTWNHLATVRSGATVYLYLNGVQIVSGAASTYLNTSATKPIQIGKSYQSTVDGLIGYVSNFRAVSSALYTANFTPPTAPLTAIAGTSLLTLQTNVSHNNSQFRDTSTNNFLVTRVGNPTQGSFSPFTKQYPYSVATVGGSVYFDSTAGDYLNIADPTGTFNFGSGNFTVEAWVYAKSGQNVNLWGNGSSGSNWVAFYTWTQAEFVIAIGGSLSIDVLTGTNSIVNDQWSHVALVRNADVFTIYINGIRANSSTRAGAVPYYDATNTYFGGPRWPGDTANSNGYMSNLRIVKGTAVYTSNFTPSTTPLTAIPGTVLLMPFTNAAVYDNTMLNNFETVGNVQVNTSTFKYGTGALKFNGSGDAIALPASANIAVGAGDFTIEMWVNASLASNSSLVGTSHPRLFTLGTAQGTGAIGFYVVSGTTATVDINAAATTITFTASTLFNSTWNHFAITRSGTSLKAFVNGTQVGSTATNSTDLNLAATTQSWLGAASASNGNLNGYIDELRITKGFARYTATFTPATGAYSASAPFGTSILPSKSLRFRASASAYLSRTPAVVGNQKTWTWSGWVKRGTLGAYNNLFGQGTSATGSGYGFIRFDAADTFSISATPDGATSDIAWTSTTVYRDPAAWYHVVAALDTTQAAAVNRFKLYINGVLQNGSFSTTPTQNVNSEINRAAGHQIGVTLTGGTPYYCDCEMAEVNFVDGLALEPTMFGAYSTYGQWLPISYAGYQGANGFYLPFTVDTSLNVTANCLVVAGGGSGAGGSGGGAGGGGAGGLIYNNSYSITPTQTYAVTVGAGGQASNRNSSGYNGSNSQFGTLIAIGGGGGGSNVTAGVAGGSGGGSGEYAIPDSRGYGGAGTAGQGFAGGNTTATGVAGGGGGAGGLGGNGSVSAAGSGGIGLQLSISGTSLYYAGGGGASGNSLPGAPGGSSIGGNGGAGYSGTGTVTSGAVNTGSGGGGIYTGASGAGGSGIVIISYSGTQKFYGGTITSTGGNTIHAFTTSGQLTGVFGDQSGNGNNWTPNNINVSTPGPTYDLLTDVPTLTSATAANYAVLNPLVPSANTFSNGNLQVAMSTSTNAKFVSTMGVSFGKFYMEFGFSIISNTPIGITSTTTPQAYLGNADGSTSVSFWPAAGSTTIYVNGSLVTWSGSATTWTTSDIAGLALDADNKTIALYKNGVLVGTAFSYSSYWTGTTYFAGGNYISGLIYYANFGQQPWTYTPPANFLALNTYNI